MQTHGDRIHYEIRGLGTGISAENQWVATTAARCWGLTRYRRADRNCRPIGIEYGTAALGHRPSRLVWRHGLAAPITEYEKRSYPIERGRATVKPEFSTGLAVQHRGRMATCFLNVDGGVVNNNPFDFAQYALMGDRLAEKTGAPAMPTGPSSTVVSPFPEPPAFLPDGQPAPELVAVLRALFPALIDQPVARLQLVTRDEPGRP